ncbi:MAG: hypothetical protein HY072_05810 [Deltaproteobacteria bacterium]|nr:hypothetical protein [Deltaproteobacteria bacterium]
MTQRLSSDGSEVSLDIPLNHEGSSATYVDQLPDNTEQADETLARNELLGLLKDKLQEFQKQLSAKELKVLTERLLSDNPKTLQELANQYGLTRERARQIETKIIAKLREFLKHYL